MSIFRIPKKKIAHVQEVKTQEHNSVLHRRGETPAVQKSVGYFSKKHASIHGKKRDCKEKEGSNVRNIKKDTKPVIPVHPHPPVVEGWAKIARVPVHSGSCYPQAGFSNMDIRCRYPPPVAHPEYGNPKPQLEMANQVRMHPGPHMGYVRPPVIAKAECNLPGAKHGLMDTDKPVKQVNVLINIPPPPPLEKLDLSSPMLEEKDAVNIQPLAHESSPVMSHDYSSDGESDVSEICKTKVASLQPSQTNVTNSSNDDKTERCKVNLRCALPSVTNETNTPDIDVADICKGSLSNAQPPNINMEETPNKNTATSVSDTSGEVLKAKEIEPHHKVTAVHESSKGKLETTGGSSKDHYQNLDKKQKIRLYEKRKKYYHESRKRYYAEKGDKKKFWYKEYEKRKKEYYHLKIYLYKEKKREYYENKILRKSQEVHSNEGSQLCDEAQTSEDKETSNDTAMEAEEAPYSPTASPIDYDDDDYSTDVPRSLLGDAPRKQTAKENDQEGNTLSNDDYDESFFKIDVKASLLDDAPRKQALGEEDPERSVLLNYSTEKLKEMIMQVMDTLHQKPGDKCNSEDQSADSEIKSKKECESKADSDKSQSGDSTSSISLLGKTSGSLSVTSASLLQQQTSTTVTPVSVTSVLDKIPRPVPPPSAPVSLPPLLLSKCVLKDSVPTSSASLMTGSVPQPVPSAAVLSSVSSSTSNKQLIPELSSSLKCVSSTETPSIALPGKHSEFEKSDLEAKEEDSVVTSTPQSGTSLMSLSPLPSLQHGKEFATECIKDSEKGSRPSVPHDDMFPPLPPPLPPPPPEEEEIARTASGSVNENEIRLEEQNASDDMTEVPMDIDSDDETGHCHDSDGDDNKVSDSHNIKDDNVLSDDIDRDGAEIVTCSDNDKQYLSKFGICEKKSPSVEKEMDEGSADNNHLSKLLKKLMRVSNEIKSREISEKERKSSAGIKEITAEKECGSSAGMKEVTTDLTLKKPSSCLDSTVLNQQEAEDCDPLREQNAPSVHSPHTGKALSPAKNKETMNIGSNASNLEETSVLSNKQEEKEKSDTTQSGNFMNEIEIIGTKEPRKNLICVDEILLSVEAADQPPDLQIIYTDLRSDPSEMRNTVRVSI